MTPDTQILRAKRLAAMAAINRKRGNSQAPSAAATHSDQDKIIDSSSTENSRSEQQSQKSDSSQEGRLVSSGNSMTSKQGVQVTAAADVDRLLAEVKDATNSYGPGRNFNSSGEAEEHYSHVQESRPFTSHHAVSKRSQPRISSLKKQPSQRKNITGGASSTTTTAAEAAEERLSSIFRESSRAPSYRKGPPIAREQVLDQRSSRPIQHHQERRIYEPSKHSLIENGARHSPLRPQLFSSSSKSTVQQDTREPGPSSVMAECDFENEFARLHADELEDLRDWLKITHYYDEEHRQRTLHRHKRLAAIELEREHLMREEQNAHEEWVKRGGRLVSLFPPGLSSNLTSSTKPSADSTSSSSSKMRPPPPFPYKTPTSVPGPKHTSSGRYTGSGFDDGLSADHLYEIGSPGGIKRQYSDSMSESQGGRSEKVMRTHSTERNDDYVHRAEGLQQCHTHERIANFRKG